MTTPAPLALPLDELQTGRQRAAAIDRLTPDERAIFVRMIAEIALARVLDDLAEEDHRQEGAAEGTLAMPSTTRSVG